MHDLGLGVAEDKDRAATLYKEAAELGGLRATLNVGIPWMQGFQRLEVDLVESYMWLDLARFYTQPSSEQDVKWRSRGLLDQIRTRLKPEPQDRGPGATLRDLFCLLPDWPARSVLELAPLSWRQTLQQQEAQQRLAAHPFRAVTIAPPR